MSLKTENLKPCIVPSLYPEYHPEQLDLYWSHLKINHKIHHQNVSFIDFKYMKLKIQYQPTRQLFLKMGSFHLEM